MTAQIIEIAGQKMVVLPAEDYERLLGALEDRDDADLAEKAAQRRSAGEDYIPLEMVDRMLAGESALRVWRQYRTLTIDALAKASGILKSTISELENAKAQGKPAAWRALADALRVTVDDILPID